MKTETFRPALLQLISVIALGGVLMSTYLMLVKLGSIGTLACGASGGCSTVQSSSWAVLFGVPVPAWGIAGYGALLVTALVALQTGARLPRLALYALAAGAVVMSAYLSALEAFVIHAWCRWCIASALMSLVIGLAAASDALLARKARAA